MHVRYVCSVGALLGILYKAGAMHGVSCIFISTIAKQLEMVSRVNQCGLEFHCFLLYRPFPVDEQRGKQQVHRAAC